MSRLFLSILIAPGYGMQGNKQAVAWGWWETRLRMIGNKSQRIPGSHWKKMLSEMVDEVAGTILFFLQSIQSQQSQHSHSHSGRGYREEVRRKKPQCNNHSHSKTTTATTPKWETSTIQFGYPLTMNLRDQMGKLTPSWYLEKSYPNNLPEPLLGCDFGGNFHTSKNGCTIHIID